MDNPCELVPAMGAARHVLYGTPWPPRAPRRGALPVTPTVLSPVRSTGVRLGGSWFMITAWLTDLPRLLPVVVGLSTVIWTIGAISAETAFGRPSSTAGIGHLFLPVVSAVVAAAALVVGVVLRKIRPAPRVRRVCVDNRSAHRECHGGPGARPCVCARVLPVLRHRTACGGGRSTSCAFFDPFRSQGLWTSGRTGPLAARAADLPESGLRRDAGGFALGSDGRSPRADRVIPARAATLRAAGSRGTRLRDVRLRPTPRHGPLASQLRDRRQRARDWTTVDGRNPIGRSSAAPCGTVGALVAAATQPCVCRFVIATDTLPDGERGL